MDTIRDQLNTLFEIMKMPDILYHTSDTLSKTLKPRVTNLFVPGRFSKAAKKAIFASHNKLYAFGLERVNVMVPGKYTEEEVNSWKKSCWLKPDPPRLIVHYWNYIPKKKFYLYHISSKGFKPYVAKTPNTTTTHWYITKEIVPLKIEVIHPSQVKGIAWKIATKKEWEKKKQSYRDKGVYK